MQNNGTSSKILRVHVLLVVLTMTLHCSVYAFSTTHSIFKSNTLTNHRRFHPFALNAENDNASSPSAGEEEASRLKSKADALREQIRQMEETLGDQRGRDYYTPIQEETELEQDLGMSLRNKKVLVVGANGRLGSMVTRYLLRNYPEVKEVVAAVHYVGEASTRGYGRLSYEVGAEDGVGSIGAAWSEERQATFQFSDEMKSYNLQNLVRVQVLLAYYVTSVKLFFTKTK